MRLDDLKIDPARKEDGAWMPMPPTDLEFKVRGAGNNDWLAVEAAESMRLRMEHRVKGDLPPEHKRSVLIACILKAGLLDWRGVVDDDGKAIAFSHEAAETILRDLAFERFVNLVHAACVGVSDIAEDEREEAEKNS